MVTLAISTETFVVCGSVFSRSTQTWAKFPLDRWMREDGFDAEGPWPILRRMDNAKVASISSKTRPFGLSMPILGGTGRYVVRASRT